ncbi:MAG: DUF4868 domain-containing protein [Acidobacteria bacterium]|nr:DUF4868 domain-containing protein [Acidobacteriota bacterium]MBS1864871.1 DUF4868 domain-containing protein [Acidobacteriota bacterium]
MTIDFDFKAISSTEFGVGRDEEGNEVFRLIAVDADVQAALKEMALSTIGAMNDASIEPSQYAPSEKYGGHENVFLPLDHELAKQLRQLHQATNMPLDSSALSDPESIFCYFARMTDNKRRRLTAVRRASQFKGVLKSRLIRVVTDALKLVEDDVFKLDSDFDVLVDDKNILMLRPNAFEFMGNLQSAVSAAAPANIKEIQKDLPFVDFSTVEDHAKRHPRAARYVASIRSQKETKNIDSQALKRLCKATGVQIEDANGQISVLPTNVMGFLEVLDRRRYRLELVKGTPESFRAASRTKLKDEIGKS